jgi:hypothetical protein
VHLTMTWLFCCLLLQQRPCITPGLFVFVGCSILLPLRACKETDLHGALYNIANCNDIAVQSVVGYALLVYIACVIQQCGVLYQTLLCHNALLPFLELLGLAYPHAFARCSDRTAQMSIQCLEEMHF